jgi:hypothetical protein
MIQRIQTIFFLLAGLAFASVILLPFATSQQEHATIFQDRQYDIVDFPVLQVLAYVAILAVVTGIFMYQRRKWQIRIGYAVIILGIVTPIVAYLYFQSTDVTDVGIQLGPGSFMPIAAALLVLAAIRFIRKDEQLVKSMDRLR